MIPPIPPPLPPPIPPPPSPEQFEEALRKTLKNPKAHVHTTSSSPYATVFEKLREEGVCEFVEDGGPDTLLVRGTDKYSGRVGKYQLLLRRTAFQSIFTVANALWYGFVIAKVWTWFFEPTTHLHVPYVAFVATFLVVRMMQAAPPPPQHAQEEIENWNDIGYVGYVTGFTFAAGLWVLLYSLFFHLGSR
jgi:hypothetical protein